MDRKAWVVVLGILVLLFVTFQNYGSDGSDVEVRDFENVTVDNIRLQPLENSEYTDPLVLFDVVRRGEIYRGRLGIVRSFSRERIENSFDVERFEVRMDNEWSWSDNFEGALNSLTPYEE